MDIQEISSSFSADGQFPAGAVVSVLQPQRMLLHGQPQKAQSMLFEQQALDDLDLRRRFKELSDKWHRETDHLSVTIDILSNRAYKEILTLGCAVVPFILEDLRTRGGHWFEALELLTKENPASGARKHSEARGLWLAWAVGKRW